MVRRLVLSLFILTSAAALAACGDTWRGVKKDTGDNLVQRLYSYCSRRFLESHRLNSLTRHGHRHRFTFNPTGQPIRVRDVRAKENRRRWWRRRSDLWLNFPEDY